jgi:hypothetical protein
MSEDLITLAMGIAIGVVPGFLFAFWEKFKAHAKATPTQIDDQAIKLIENMAEKIAAAKVEQPPSAPPQ